MIKLFSLFKPKTPNIHLPAKVSFYEGNGIKYLNRMPVKAKDDVVFIHTIHDEKDKHINTFITDKDNNKLGYHEYYISNGLLDGDYMEVYHRYQGKGLGELLRLASIMMFKENNLNTMTLTSMNSALPFHIKYKLKPDMEAHTDTSEDILKMILINKVTSKDFKNKASGLLDNVWLMHTARAGDKYLEDLSDFITQYVIQNRKRWDDANFRLNVPLLLDSKTIKHNADFYNKLFKKHDIDYKI